MYYNFYFRLSLNKLTYKQRHNGVLYFLHYWCRHVRMSVMSGVCVGVHTS